MNHKESWTYPVSGHRYLVQFYGVPIHPGQYEVELLDGDRYVMDVKSPEEFPDIRIFKAWKLLHKS